MRKDDEQYVVSTSHVGLRVAAFVLALLLAVGAFSYGISRIGHKEPGYYEIQAEASAVAQRYANGITLLYYFDGESNAIRESMNRLKGLYSAVLLRSYQLLDADVEYDGYVNMASLNHNLGAEMTVSQELFQILQDAWARTQEQRGFHLCAGALSEVWNSILSLDDIAEYDPATNEDTAARIQALAEATADLSHFSLEMDAASCRVKLNVSGEYRALLQSQECQGAIFTTGALTDAYRLQMIRSELESNGFTRGYLYTDSGLTLNLSEHTGAEYALYGYVDGGAFAVAGIPAAANSACSFLHAFPMVENETMYHVVQDAQGTRYYHPQSVAAAGVFSNGIASSCAVRYDGDIVAACYDNLTLYHLPSRAEIAAADFAETDIAFTCFGEEDTVYANHPQRVNPAGGFVLLAAQSLS